MPKLTSYLPSTSISASDINIPKGIDLADPSFNTSNKIDMIIGSEIFFELICADQIKFAYYGPTFQNTLFGWVVAGPISGCKERVQVKNNVISLYCSTSPSLTSLEEQIAKFWRLEEIQCKTYSLVEKTCKTHFDENVKRADDGRFIVSLPFREASILGKSYDIALRRFLSLERRFQTQPKLKEDYKKFMDEYIALGHMEVVTAEERSVYIKKNYLPHHAVTKESSSTTKLRVVFDASCKTDTGVSLNDTLYKGPSIQEELVCIMARFRTHKYVISADIVKMYRQIWIAQHHQDYQRILWRSSPELPIQIYRLKTITYGVLTASFLATGCLQKLAEEEHKIYANACRAIRQDFYMDDLLTGADTIENTLKLRNDIIAVLKTAGLELRKWSSNVTELLREVSKIDLVHENSNSNSNNYEEKVTKLLGLFWNQENDSYQYMVESYNSTSRITKRNVLSEIASVFDPLGLISPIVVRLKLIMQKLWQLNINWDEALPSEICCEWRKNRIDLEQINSLAINRFIINSGKICNVQIHGFADASISAYGACLYLRTTNDNGNIKTSLICAKSRVAPLKVVTLPRLELLAALLLARLSAKYIPCLQLHIDETYYWTDSTIVLAWISSPSSRWKTFVGHRVSEIQELSSVSQWKHVNTNENPADIVSRGCSSSQIINSRLWWNGPEWLQAGKSDWPKTNYSLDEDNILEERPVTKIIMSTTRDTSLLNKYSTLSKLVRIVAYCLRFKNNAKPNSKKISGNLLFDELEYATTAIVKLVQSNAWHNELKCLEKSLPIKNNSPLIRLKPFLDENHVIRVGGRLKNSSTLDVFQKHPVVLPAGSQFTRLIFSNEHEKSMHGGPQSILARIRLRYWPLNGRNIARAVVQRCVKCFKYKPIVVQPIMGDLPKDRVEPARAFAKCGVDFAGPVYVKSSLRRKAATNKAYICVWVCFVTKAIHIELVGDLTTEAFLNALNRFFDRRGVCSDIYSDNATNFVGANRHLQGLKQLFLSVDHQNKMQNALNKIGVNWHFIPPRSPHFGGLWEASVKSNKSHLYKTLGNAALTYEELYTVLVRVEAILNSRPLTPISTDPTDLTVLTPSHFLIGDNLSSIPERNVSTTPPNRLTRWKRVTQLTQQLWQRWKHEYLNQLQVRDKWCRSKGPPLSTNTIVLLRDDKHPPLHWKIGRVIDTHEDSDGVIRVATVRTSEGLFKRAVRLLCPLPFEGNVKST